MLFSLFSCEDEKKGEEQHSVTKQEMIDNNRKSVHVEADQIKKYINRRGYTMTETGSGLHYMVYSDFADDGQAPEENDTVFVSYTVSLINGKEIYTSDPKDPAKFVVGHDNVESGLQEGIRFLEKGDKAIFIIPAHLAHGYTGDFNKIPRSSTVIFDIELLDIK